MSDPRCPSCGQHLDAQQRGYETRRRLARETMRGDDLERGLKEIITALASKQPMPRTWSATYVAGYARAMDDMKRIVLDVVRDHGRVASPVATPETRPVAPRGATPQVGAPQHHELPPAAPPGIRPLLHESD